jgi:hypothetical protein
MFDSGCGTDYAFARGMGLLDSVTTVLLPSSAVGACGVHIGYG